MSAESTHGDEEFLVVEPLDGAVVKARRVIRKLKALGIEYNTDSLMEILYIITDHSDPKIVEDAVKIVMSETSI